MSDKKFEAEVRISRINLAKSASEHASRMLEQRRAEFVASYGEYEGPISAREFSFFLGKDEEGVNPLKDLESQVEKNIGKEVLVVHQTTKKISNYPSYPSGGINGNMSFHIDTEVILNYGILSGAAQLLFPAGEILLPTGGRHVTTKSGILAKILMNPTSSLVAKDLTTPYSELPHLFRREEDKMPSLLSIEDLPYSISRILTGNNVGQYFRINCAESAYEKVRSLLNAKILMSP